MYFTIMYWPYGVPPALSYIQIPPYLYIGGVKWDGQIYIHTYINTENMKTVNPHTSSNDELLGGTVRYSQNKDNHKIFSQTVRIIDSYTFSDCLNVWLTLNM